ncbi:hypothetical protein BH11BAC3_BH11BAC3_30140 [soil metagenome]
MKKILLLALVAGFILGSCKKADEKRYNSHDNIYLDFGGSDRDSMLYTFAYNPSFGKDTMYVPVRISGIRSTVDRKFILKVLQDSSTALPNKHYKPLADTYIMPKDTGFVNVPIEIYNTDPLLEKASVTLRVRLMASEDFDVNIPKLIDGKIVFSNKLERPGWWGMWFGGYYSRVKHEFFLITSGLESLSTNGLDAPKNLYFVSLVNSFLSDPAKWISKNQSKGYMLKLRTDGNYDFYNINNPTRTVLYRNNAQAGKFFFIDENGIEVQ